jgi:hypothetical protein
MPTLTMRDVSRAGHELGHRRLEDLPATLSLGALLTARVRADVAAYNAEVGPVFQGLVQPADAVRHSDGHRMPRPRPLNAEPMVAAAEDAVATGRLMFRVGVEVTADLDATVRVDELDEVTAVLARSIVAPGD